jgi:hypothetical protein
MADPLVEVTDPQVGSLSPLSDEPLTAEDELAAVEDAIRETNIDIQQPLVETTDDPADSPPLGRSFAFDPFERKFVVGDGAHGPRETRGFDTLGFWIQKALATERGTSPIHSDDYGLQDVDGVIGTPADILTSRASRVRDALTFHPRITDVRNYSAIHEDPDAQWVTESFDVVLDDETIVPLSVMRRNVGG